jgi:hypothetical protein
MRGFSSWWSVAMDSTIQSAQTFTHKQGQYPAFINAYSSAVYVFPKTAAEHLEYHLEYTKS